MNLSTLHKPIERGEAFYRRMNKPCDDSLDSRKSNSTWAIQQLMLFFKVAIPLFVIVGLASLIRGVGQVATGQQGLSGLGVKPYENGLSNLRGHDTGFSPVHHSRALLTSNYIALAGSENKINTYTASNQQTPSGSLLPNGDLFIVWSSNAQDGASGGIYGKIVTINGIESVSEFRINTETVNDQSVPSIATSSNGSSLVAWQSNLQDGSAYGIYAQIVSETGSKVGSEFRVNTYTDSDQKAPSVAALTRGGWVVGWESVQEGDFDTSGIYGQIYDENGGVIGSEIHINTVTAQAQTASAFVGLKGGGFVAAWKSFLQDGSDYGIYVQVFDANGVKVGSETLANTFVNSAQRTPSIAADPWGGFGVLWESFSQDGSNYGIFGQRFLADATKQGSEIQLNTYSTSNQQESSLAFLPNGIAIATWQSSGQDGSSNGVYFQILNSDWSKHGSETQANTYTLSNQQFPVVIGVSNTTFTLLWQSSGQDGDLYGVYAKTYELVEPPTASPTPFPTTSYPTVFPSRNPTFFPTFDPSIVVVTMAPSQSPTLAIRPPTGQPSGQPSSRPSGEPTVYFFPSGFPTNNPSGQPSSRPSLRPSGIPTLALFFPSVLPTSSPSGQPSGIPTWVTLYPSGQPSSRPSLRPSGEPTVYFFPSGFPTNNPSGQPSGIPTLAVFFPSGLPTNSPSGQPSGMPTWVMLFPSGQPSSSPSSRPSLRPSLRPSGEPTVYFFPSGFPTNNPSGQPSGIPTLALFFPSGLPTNSPSGQPSGMPTFMFIFSNRPTGLPSVTPSTIPTYQPSEEAKSETPTGSPTVEDTVSKTLAPTGGPRVDADIPGWVIAVIVLCSVASACGGSVALHILYTRYKKNNTNVTPENERKTDTVDSRKVAPDVRINSDANNQDIQHHIREAEDVEPIQLENQSKLTTENMMKGAALANRSVMVRNDSDIASEEIERIMKENDSRGGCSLENSIRNSPPAVLASPTISENELETPEKHLMEMELSPALWDNWIAKYQYTSTFRQVLWDVVNNSIEDQSIGHAAANAVSILHRAGEIFSGQDLSGICIPGASLRGAVLHRVDFSHADLTDVDFTNADLSDANMNHATVDGIILKQDWPNEIPEFNPSDYKVDWRSDDGREIKECLNRLKDRFKRLNIKRFKFNRIGDDTVIMADNSGNLILYNPMEGAVEKLFRSEEKPLAICTSEAAQYSLSSSRAKSSVGETFSDMGLLSIYDKGTNTDITVPTGNGAINDVIIHRGMGVTVGENGIKFWQLRTGKLLNTIVSEKLEGLLNALEENGNLEGFKIRHLALVWTVVKDDRSGVNECELTVVGSGGKPVVITVNQSKKTVIINGRMIGNPNLTVTATNPEVTAIGLSGNGLIMATANRSRLAIRKFNAGMVECETNTQTSRIISMDLNQDGTFIFCGSTDGQLTIWRRETRTQNELKEVARLEAHLGEVVSVKLSNDGKRLVTTDASFEFKVWDVKACEEENGHPILLQSSESELNLKYLTVKDAVNLSAQHKALIRKYAVMTTAERQMERLNVSRIKESIQEDSEDESEGGGSVQFSVSSDGGKRSPLIIGQIKGNVPVLSDDERSQASMDERVMGELHHGSLSSDEEASIESI